ncbi:PEP-CTERM sorting domain-containing protein [Massilia sp. METH4]|uniref:PEP-CTERM sorting domain-containing protein n=1 Tax=Massilia sp. METH4 TaxID=3123041 RepID=UPI0030CD2B45
MNEYQACPGLRRKRTALSGVAALLAVVACTSASAETYTITTRTMGNTAAFNLPGFFPQGDLAGARSFDLTVTSVFDSANVLSSTDNLWMQASDAALQITLRLDGEVFSLDGTGQVSSQVLSDTDGTGRTTKRFYQSVSLDPATFGDFATVQQYVFLGADQFAINSVLEPALAYYANPLTKGFSIVNSTMQPDGSLALAGDAVGRADQFSYQLAVSVPEPATYAMFGAGLALLPFAARRRRA